jgi:hypothetical protein
MADISTIPLNEIPRLVQRRGLIADVATHPLLTLSPQAGDFSRRREIILENVDFSSVLQLLPVIEGPTFALLLQKFFSFSRSLPFETLKKMAEKKWSYLRLLLEWNQTKGFTITQEQLAELLLISLQNHGALEIIKYLDARCIQNVDNVNYSQIITLSANDNPDRFLFYLEKLCFLNWIRPLNFQEYLKHYENQVNEINKVYLKTFQKTLDQNLSRDFEIALQERKSLLTYVRRFSSTVDEGYSDEV